MPRAFKLFALLILITSPFFPSTQTAHARGNNEADWVKLGEAQAGRDPDHDEFNVDRPDLSFSKIRFRVHGPAVHFIHVQVTFDDNDKEEIDLDLKVGNDNGTGPLSLHGKHRTIKHVIVSYQTVGHHRGGDGVVSLWGLK